MGAIVAIAISAVAIGGITWYALYQAGMEHKSEEKKAPESPPVHVLPPVEVKATPEKPSNVTVVPHISLERKAKALADARPKLAALSNDALENAHTLALETRDLEAQSAIEAEQSKRKANLEAVQAAPKVPPVSVQEAVKASDADAAEASKRAAEAAEAATAQAEARVRLEQGTTNE